jgi:hypothetical protein
MSSPEISWGGHGILPAVPCATNNHNHNHNHHTTTPHHHTTPTRRAVSHLHERSLLHLAEIRHAQLASDSDPPTPSAISLATMSSKQEAARANQQARSKHREQDAIITASRTRAKPRKCHVRSSECDPFCLDIASLDMFLVFELLSLAFGGITEAPLCNSDKVDVNSSSDMSTNAIGSV